MIIPQNSTLTQIITANPCIKGDVHSFYCCVHMWVTGCPTQL